MLCSPKFSNKHQKSSPRYITETRGSLLESHIKLRKASSLLPWTLVPRDPGPASRKKAGYREDRRNLNAQAFLGPPSLVPSLPCVQMDVFLSSCLLSIQP